MGRTLAVRNARSESGIAEKNCVFRTRFPGESLDDVRVINHYEPNTRIDFVRVNALRTMCLSISAADSGDGTARAVNKQILVGLTEQGNESLDSMADSFSFEMRMGEVMLNHYMTTGKRLPLQDALTVAKEQK